MQLLKEVKEFRVETEEDAIALVQKFKDEQGTYEVIKSCYTMKTKKSKGEIIDTWFVVSITMNYNLEA